MAGGIVGGGMDNDSFAYEREKNIKGSAWWGFKEAAEWERRGRGGGGRGGRGAIPRPRSSLPSQLPGQVTWNKTN